MIFCYPALECPGWHFEVLATWRQFGAGVCAVWGVSYVIWLGPLTVLAWKFDE